MGFVPIPCLCLGCWTTATFGKGRAGCALWLKFGGFLLAKPLQNQPTWEEGTSLREGHPSVVCIWMGTSPRALQASSPSCQLLQGQGYVCSAIKEPRDLREVGMREERILTQEWPTSKRHRAVLTPHKAGGRKQCLCLPGAGRAAGAEQTACRSLLLPPTRAGNTAWLSHSCWGPCDGDSTPLCRGLCFGPWIWVKEAGWPVYMRF